MCWMLFLLAALSGLHQAELLATHFGITAAEVRYAIGGLLLGLPVALGITAAEQRLGATRHRFSRY